MKERKSAILGAAFLMATSAIGPGFLTQTTVFTQKLLASFGFVILITILLDIAVQLNIWRILTMSNLKAQDAANKVLPGLGYFLAAIIVLGGLAFNIGNLAGSGLGLQVLFGISPEAGAAISCMVALIIFWMKEVGNTIDWFAKVLGILMILLTGYVAVSSHPPLLAVVHRTFVPVTIDPLAIVTLVGGTVGGYISFAGAHRLLDAGVVGQVNLHKVNRSAISGIVITGLMRMVLFLGALGVVTAGVELAKGNPAASIFQAAAGSLGYRFFGVVIWSAAITSVVGCAYTSITFVAGFHSKLFENQRWIISAFILISAFIFIVVGNPVRLLVLAGTLNGITLPVALAIVLIVSRNRDIIGSYRHPLWLQVIGWVVVVVMGAMSLYSLVRAFA
ncbi:MAG: divalent metal cation transporter [Flammeovirgaceae bacterium]|nr:divalent metal cation transporter [Flammeovirgaceae bacterium]MCZ8072471.1 divalent metal cation transporter [Cytophagales bacterium]